MEIPTIETDRLVLRAIRESDLDDLERILTDEENSKWVGGPAESRQDCWYAIARWLGHWALRGYGHFGVEERASGAFVGRVGLIYPEGWPGLEIGWLIDKRRWGEGFATEGARAVLGFAWDVVGAEHLISLIHPDNAASIRVAEKIGETLEGRADLNGTEVLRYGISR